MAFVVMQANRLNFYSLDFEMEI